MVTNQQDFRIKRQNTSSRRIWYHYFRNQTIFWAYIAVVKNDLLTMLKLGDLLYGHGTNFFMFYFQLFFVLQNKKTKKLNK